MWRFQKCWFGQGIPSKSNAKPLFGIHSFHKVTLFTMTCDVSEPVLMNVSASATPQALLRSRVCEVNTMVSGGQQTLRNITKKSRLRSKYNGVGGTAGSNNL